MTEHYIRDIVHNDDLETHENRAPALFQEYFSYWGEKKYWHQTLSEKAVFERRKLIMDELSFCEKMLENAGLDVGELSVYLMVGQGTTNGHAFWDGEKFCVFLALEGYTTREQVRVFGIHEMIHTLHYTRVPSLYFRKKQEKENLARELITEGLATFLSKYVLGISEKEALWADILTDEDFRDWHERARKISPEIVKEIRGDFRTRGSEKLFMASDFDSVREYRIGYFIGLKIFEKIQSKHKFLPLDFLEMSRPKIEALFEETFTTGNMLN